MRVIGTAGHVDHGKSTLIAALTGVHPDRLKEEQEREMTIELGFGWLTLPTGEQVGIVDVPGHRDFIENMLAGVGGIDAALLVIAADEGVMPQTREHLAILDLLQIPAGIIVLTKTDLASDSAWLGLVEKEVRAAVSGTVMDGAPLVQVSAKNKSGLDELVSTLTEVLHNHTPRPDLGRARLPIDRVFTMSGFGTVVTGTLTDGHLALEDEIEILPGGARGRVRGLQTHKTREARAVPGSRTAVNISNIPTEQIHRGDVLAQPGQYQPTRRLDARLQVLKDAAAPVRHDDEIKLFLGTSERVARLRVLDAEDIKPGEKGWIQLELRDPVVAVRGDRYILRRPSPGETLGGGVIVDHQPRGRHKRFDETVLRSLSSLAEGAPSDILFEAALALHFTTINEILTRSRVDPITATTALEELITQGRLISLLEDAPGQKMDMLVIALPHWNNFIREALQVIENYHKNFPLRRGIPREELKSRLQLEPYFFNGAMKKLLSDHALVEIGSSLGLADHEVKFDPNQRASIQALMTKFSENPFGPPSVKEAQAEVDEEVFNALLEAHELVAVSQDVVFRKQDYDSMLEKIRQTLQKNGKITLAEVRDLFSTSRKYAQALLEHLDAIGMTVREGDYRKLKI